MPELDPGGRAFAENACGADPKGNTCGHACNHVVKANAQEHLVTRELLVRCMHRFEAAHQEQLRQLESLAAAGGGRDPTPAGLPRHALGQPRQRCRSPSWIQDYQLTPDGTPKGAEMQHDWTGCKSSPPGLLGGAERGGGGAPCSGAPLKRWASQSPARTEPDWAVDPVELHPTASEGLTASRTSYRRASESSDLAAFRLCDEEAPAVSFVRRMDLKSEASAVDFLRRYGENVEHSCLRKIFIKLADCGTWYNNQLGDAEFKRTGGVLNRIVTSRAFEFVTMLVIILNGCFISYETNYGMQRQMTVRNDIVVNAEIAFISYYSMELILKLLAWRQHFFIGSEWRWNLFDLVIVVASAVDLAGSVLKQDLSFLRMLRFFKFGKIIRMFRLVKFLTDLRLMLDCLLGSFVQLMWCIVMIMFITYMFALWFVQELTAYLETTAVSTAQVATVKDKFGSVQVAMLSLFQATTGGVDWDVLYEIIQRSGPIAPVIFLFYIAVFIIAVWNIVTSTFVEKALKFAKPDIDTLMLEKRRKDFKDAKELADLFRRCAGKSNTITKKTFTRIVENPEFEAFLCTRGIDIKEAQTFFSMITSSSSSDEVDISTVVGSCIRIKGLASSIDLHTLHYEVRVMRRLHTKFFEESLQLLRAIAMERDPILEAPRRSPSTGSMTGDNWCGEIAAEREKVIPV